MPVLEAKDRAERLLRNLSIALKSTIIIRCPIGIRCDACHQCTVAAAGTRRDGVLGRAPVGLSLRVPVTLEIPGDSVRYGRA